MSVELNKQIGDFGEHLILNRLRNLGRPKRQTIQYAGDIAVNGVKVEVKTSRIGRVNQTSQGWQFCLRRRGHTDISHSDILILVGLDEHYEIENIWIIPVANLRRDRRKINIKQGTASKWNHFLDNWQCIPEGV